MNEWRSTPQAQAPRGAVPCLDSTQLRPGRRAAHLQHAAVLHQSTSKSVTQMRGTAERRSSNMQLADLRTALALAGFVLSMSFLFAITVM